MPRKLQGSIGTSAARYGSRLRASRPHTINSGAGISCSAARIRSAAVCTLASPSTNHQNRRSCTAQCGAQDSVASRQGQQPRQHGTNRRPIGLVNAVAHRHPQQVAAGLRKRQPQQAHRLQVRDHVRARVDGAEAWRAPCSWPAARPADTMMALHSGGGTTRAYMHPRAPRPPRSRIRPASRPPRCPDALPAPTLLPGSAHRSIPVVRNGQPAQWPPAGRQPMIRSPCRVECHWPCEWRAA